MSYPVFQIALGGEALQGVVADLHLIIIVAGVYTTRTEADAAVREYTKHSAQFQYWAGRAPPGPQEALLDAFLADDKYLVGRRFFVGRPPLADLQAAHTRNHGILAQSA